MLHPALSQSPFAGAQPVAFESIRRTRVSLKVLPEVNPGLATAYAHWSARRQGGLIPKWSGSDVHDLRPYVDRLQVVEALDVRPMAGRFQSIIDVLGTQGNYDAMSSFMDLPLECPTKDMIVRGMLEDYTNVVFFGSPAAHQLAVTAPESSAAFHRLILPLAADQRHVSLLLVCIGAACA